MRFLYECVCKFFSSEATLKLNLSVRPPVSQPVRNAKGQTTSINFKGFMI